jgi:alpha-amylase/alpha-mannosidase (GH57 family)
MARVSFLWHLHQPQYRTADGTVRAPWVLLHAAGEYLTLALSLRDKGLRGQVLNLTPVFLEQLAAYRDGVATDPLLEALRTPARELAPDQQHELLRWAFLLHPNRLHHWPRLEELAERSHGASSEDLLRRYTSQDLNDLQVLLVLAYAAPNLRWEEGLRDLAGSASSFGDSARRHAVAWLEGCPGRLLDLYAELAARPGVEISTSPYAHPIMPLLIDTGIVAESWAPHPPPPVPRFSAPEDAEEQLVRGLELVRELGFSPLGCWPPEGSVSEAAVAMYGNRGVRWLATDEGILAASLRRPVSGETGVARELFRPWRLRAGGPLLFFRHRGLSDFIGFQASHYPDESHAARDFVGQMRQLSHTIDDDGGILVALDGENPWTGFPAGGVEFLSTLADALEHCAELRPATLAERAAEEPPLTLERLHPGSWIGGVFATWIGHPEKNRGWELLGQAAELGARRGGRSWLAAEGSDWWWWLGDDNPTMLAPLYDELFRAHLRDACTAAGVRPPAELAAPVRSASVRLEVPLSREWPAPVLDGRITSFFEWAVAAWVEAPSDGRRFTRVALRSDGESLWLLVETRPGQEPAPLHVTVVEGTDRESWTLPEDLADRCAVDRCLEAKLPAAGRDVLMAIEIDGERLPAEGFWRLDLVEVDES